MYIIGDVHGCYDTLMALIAKLPPDSELCFVGDLIDRGPDSAKVVEFVKSNNHHCVLGNHEQMMIDHVPPGPYGGQSHWYGNGGDATVRSYADEGMYIEHLNWMMELPYVQAFGSLPKINGRTLVVSHSCAFDHLLKDADLEDVLWNRRVATGTLPSSHEYFNVFGHTVQEHKPLIKEHFACIDTGAVYREYKSHGVLTALHYPSLEIVQQENIEKET